MNVDAFCSLLRNVRPSGDGWVARCPAHDDQRASFSVGGGRGGRILIRCHAGCKSASVVAALGLKWSDLAPERSQRKSKSPKIEAVYDYRRADGRLLYQVLRYTPKSFKQRRQGEEGRWIWKVDGVQRVLYRLPELLSADPSLPVFVPEGEKDVNRLAELGLVATTNPMGAGRWRPEYSEHLRDRHVVVLPDHDDPGQKHGEDIARSLRGIAASIQVLALPGLTEKGDVSSWLDGGGTPDELQRLAREAPEYAAPEIPPLNQILDRLLRFICRFVQMSTAQAVTLVLWILHTHVFSAADATPYLHVSSPEKRCGKTRLLEVLKMFVARPWLTGRVTAAVLVRKVDAETPTLLLDESDAAFNGEKDYAEALRGILNTGYLRGGASSVCVGQGANISYQDFSTFSPKAIAGLGKLPDTVADRAILIRLKRQSDSERCERLGPKKKRSIRSEVEALRTDIETWASLNVSRLADAEPDLPEELNDRAQDVVEPLLAIAHLAGGEWPRKARSALLELCTANPADGVSLGVLLLGDCRTVFNSKGRKVDRVSTADLIKALDALEESPWREMNKGKGFTGRGLARLLNPFGITSGTLRFDAVTVKGFYRATFEDSWKRYLQAEKVGEPERSCPEDVTPSHVNNSAAFLALSKRHNQEDMTDKKREIVNAEAAGDGVTSETDGLASAALHRDRRLF